MKAIIKQTEGLSLMGKANSGHWVAMDGSKLFGGTEAASTPIELLLIGTGGCMSMDIISILTKKRIRFTFECHLDAERVDDHPKVFKDLNIKFVLTGPDISSDAVERAIELSRTKYCSALSMLEKSVNIVVDYEIVASDH